MISNEDLYDEDEQEQDDIYEPTEKEMQDYLEDKADRYWRNKW
jgi:hypothetical protein